MVRPKKWKSGFDVRSFVIPREFEQAFSALQAWAASRGMSLSESLSRAVDSFMQAQGWKPQVSYEEYVKGLLEEYWDERAPPYLLSAQEEDVLRARRLLEISRGMTSPEIKALRDKLHTRASLTRDDLKEWLEKEAELKALHDAQRHPSIVIEEAKMAQKKTAESYMFPKKSG